MKKQILWTSISFTILGLINTILYVILSCLNIFSYGVMGYLLLILFFAVVWIPLLLNKIFKLKFNLAVLISYDLFMFVAIVVGSVWRVYDYSAIFDKIVHFGSGVLFALLFYNIFTNDKKNKINLFWLFIFAFSFSMMIGGVWEILEFTFDGLLGRNAQRWQDFMGRETLYDTMFDLISDFAGSVLGAIVSIFIERKGKRSENEIKNQSSNVEYKSN